MHVADVMTRGVFAVARDTSLETAARLLTTKHISAAPVVAANGRPVGIVSLTDLVDPDRPRSNREGYPLFYRVVAGVTKEIGDDIEVGPGQVQDVMSEHVLSIDSSATVHEAARRLVTAGIHRLLVVDSTKLVGIVSALDLLRGMLRENE